MKVAYVDSSGFSIIQCEHCSSGQIAFKPVREDILRIAFCGVCRKDSQGNDNPFNLSEFLKTGG